MSRFDYTETERKAEARIKYIKQIKCQIAYYQGEYNACVERGEQDEAAYYIKKFYEYQDLLVAEEAA